MEKRSREAEKKLSKGLGKIARGPLGGWIVLFFPITILCLSAFIFLYKRDVIAEGRKHETFFTEQLREMADDFEIDKSERIQALTENTSSGVQKIYNVISNQSLSAQAIKELEESAISQKLGLLQNILNYHPEEGNYDFKIIERNDELRLSDYSKKLQTSTLYTIRYSGLMIPDDVFFKTYLVQGLQPEKVDDFRVRARNLFSKRNYTSDEIGMIPLGADEKKSPFCLLKIKLDPKKDFDRNNETKIELVYSSSQNVPYSILFIQSHRYKRGIDSWKLHVLFSESVILECKELKLHTFDFKEICSEERLEEIIIPEKTKKINGRYSEIGIGIENPKEIFVLTIFTFS